MSTNELIPALALVTLGAFLAVAIWQFASFLRKRRNRESAAKVLTD